MQNMHGPQRRQIVMRTQSRLQGRHRALMSDVGRGPIIMVSILPRERMVASRVGVEADIRLAAQSVDDLCVRLGRKNLSNSDKCSTSGARKYERASCRERVCQAG